MASSLHRDVLTQSTSESPTKLPPSRTAPPNASLDRSRADLIRDLNEKVSVIETPFFFDHLLPPSPLRGTKTASDIVASMKESEQIDEKYWAGWVKPSARAGTKEDKVFSELENLTKAIQEASGLGTPAIEFLCNGAISLGCYTRNNTSKPDFYAIRNPTVAKGRFVKDILGIEQPLWLDVAVPGEFKKNRTSESFNDNAKKVLWSMYHIMREDARRRFIIGFSIDNTDMRLWYFSRSDAYVSKVFNFLEAHELVVEFVLRISYASAEQLGWDPTMTLHTPRKGQPLEYDIEVTETVEGEASIRKFRTVRLLSGIGAENLHGRGTRVWEVAELDERDKVKPGNHFALKDSWVDADREREAKIMADIRNTAKERGEMEDAAMETYLLTVVTFGDVRIADDVDKTRRWDPPPFDEQLDIQVNPSDTGHVVSNEALATVGAYDVETTPLPAAVEPFSTKVHHRVVFKEVGKTMRQVTSLREAFSCLAELIFALRILHILGWVHRDISCGNVLIVDGVPKLADLEYAKTHLDTTPHGVRTGTMYFMALEVDQHKYLHTSRKESGAAKPEKNADDGQARWLAIQTRRRQASLQGKTSGADSEKKSPAPPATDAENAAKAVTVPFKHNPLHDLESVFWLAMYVLLVGRLLGDGSTPPDALVRYTKAQNNLAIKLFREHTFRLSAVFPNVLSQELDKVPLAPRVRLIANYLDEMLDVLVTAFQNAEKDLTTPIPFTIAKELQVYGALEACFDKITALLSDTPECPNADIAVVIDEASARRLKKAKKAKDRAAGGDADSDDSDDSDDELGDGSDDAYDPRPSKKQRNTLGGDSTLRSSRPYGTRKSSRSALTNPSHSAPSAVGITRK